MKTLLSSVKTLSPVLLFIKILNFIGSKYYQFFIFLMISILKSHSSIRLIIINGSYARKELRCFSSDVDLSIVLYEDRIEPFWKRYRLLLILVSPFFPFFLPLKERKLNIFSFSELMNPEMGSTFRGYLKHAPYVIKYGNHDDLRLMPSHFLDTILYQENKLSLYISAKPKNLIPKRDQISLLANSPQIPLFINSEADTDKKKLEAFTLGKLHLSLPYLASEQKNDLYFYTNLSDFLFNTNKALQDSNFYQSIHFFHPWIVYIDNEAHAIRVDRIKHLFMKNLPETDLESIKQIYFYDLKHFNHLFLNDFSSPFKPSKRLDIIDKNVIQEIASYKDFYDDFFSKGLISIKPRLDFYKAINFITNPGPVDPLKLSLCICTKNRPQELLELCRSINNQTILPHEILIINNGKHFTNDFVEEMKLNHLRILNSDLDRISSLRNLAIEHATGDIVCFTDDDCYLNNDWLEKISRNFENDPSLDLLGGRVTHWMQNNQSSTELFHRAMLGETS